MRHIVVRRPSSSPNSPATSFLGKKTSSIAFDIAIDNKFKILFFFFFLLNLKAIVWRYKFKFIYSLLGRNSSSSTYKLSASHPLSRRRRRRKIRNQPDGHCAAGEKGQKESNGLGKKKEKKNRCRYRKCKSVARHNEKKKLKTKI